jgi:putative PIN family toxin of toxin-antitoxin system
MNDKPGLVVDTNVMVSAVLSPPSIPARAVNSALQTGVILLSLPVLRELQEVMFRAKLDRYVTIDERRQFLAMLIDSSRPIETVESLRVCRDPRDDKFLELAIAGNAHVIISGDKDLLALSPFRDVQIVTPAEYLERIK